MNASAYGLETLNGDAEDQRAGQLFCGKWTLEHLLGVGAAGAVYAARHRNGNRVAIKVARSMWAASPQMRERFLNEARASNRVEHRAVVRVHDEGVADDGSIFLVMDLLQGQTLQEYQEHQGPLSAAQALLVGHELLDVLEAAHAVGVLHRDVKPANVFLNWDGRVLLLDFGVARLSESRFLTQTGIPVGTPSFMPPEQAAGRWTDVDGRSDLWSVGATLFTLLSGQTVRQARSLEDELRAALDTPARPLAEVCDVPDAVARLVDKALALDPAARFQSAEQMREAVREAMLALGIPLPNESQLPGVAAGLVPVDAGTPPRVDESPSAIRLKALSAEVAPASTLPELWARQAQSGVARLRQGFAATLLVGAVSVLGWHLYQDALPVQHLREDRVMYWVQSGLAGIIRPEVGQRIAEDYALDLQMSTGVTREAVAHLPEAAPEPARRRSKPRPKVVTKPAKAPTPPEVRRVRMPPKATETVEPEPFDPLASRL